ncbi:hypothetical protein INS90_04125 [Trueperella pecoris]|uniref:Uncharacterized protein n=1 Tax=Trueperella pecoris TaxID=2733571 RepID=A0A7M1R2U8_9ACTO|nr:hypothetical protein [Trueperella pecoris]QOR48461.1 hypothetical protein INS90_04125 [Trueperella pecoris]
MEFFGISGGEFIIILVVAVIVLGPEAITGALRGFRTVVDAAKSFSARVREETTADLHGLSDVDLSALDMRGLDPRQVIREAVHEEMQAWAQQTSALNQKKK